MYENIDDTIEKNDDEKSNVTHLKEGQFLIPGFIDCHIHAVQLPNIGLGYDEPLLDWLENYTYPLENKYTDLKFSEKVYDAVVVKENYCSFISIFFYFYKFKIEKKNIYIYDIHDIHDIFLETNIKCWNNYCLLLWFAI